MYGLEIKEEHQINNCKYSYERKAIPVTTTFRYKIIAKCEDKQALINYAEKLPLQWFYDRIREYNIIEFTTI